MARGSAESLDICYSCRSVHGFGHICMVYRGARSAGGWSTLVSERNRCRNEDLKLTRRRLFPFGIVTAALTLLFLLLILVLAAQRLLIPGIILLGSFILFVLWLTTLIETSIQLFGPSGNVNSNCNAYVTGQEYRGISVETLAWLTQSNICACWKAVFAWALISTSMTPLHAL